MGGHIRQRRGFLKLDAELLAEGVFYRERGVFRSHESTIPFEEIDDSLTRAFYVNRLYLGICVFFAFLFAFRLYGFIAKDTVSTESLLLSASWCALAILGTWMNSARYVGYASRKGGIYFFDTRGRQNPAPFLQEMQQAKQQYLRARYAETTPRGSTRGAAAEMPAADGARYDAN